MIEKVCSKCGESFPATAEYFQKNKRSIDDLDHRCKKCAREYLKRYYKKNKAKRQEYNKLNKKRIKKTTSKYYKQNKNTIKKQGKILMETLCRFDSITIKRLIKYEDIKRDVYGFAKIKCAYCGRYYIPKYKEARSRLGAIDGVQTGESRFYCSESCKESCPTYHRKKYPKGFKKATSREANPTLRQLVLKRDNYTCQKCGVTEYLHCHHVVPATQNPMTANDPDACITLCKECHKAVHQKAGCKYHELKCA